MLNTETMRLNTYDQPHAFFKGEGYAILSHRWENPEITFDQMRAGELSGTVPQSSKIQRACETAKSRDLKWIWIDTCCINKDSQSELAEALNSMFKWYREAKVCFAYLFDVRRETSSKEHDVFRRQTRQDDPHSEDGVSSKHSVWFSRGWTLQELLAPKVIQFYDMDWNELGTRSELAQEIEGITKIDARYLREAHEGGTQFRTVCIATKMSWMANRTTTRDEDMAYSMLGLFDVSMAPIPGEGGPRAFARLQKELLKNVLDESIFAWKMPKDRLGAPSTNAGWASDEWGLLAPHPKCFDQSHGITINGEKIPRKIEGSEPFALTRDGIRIPHGGVGLKTRYFFPIFMLILPFGIPLFVATLLMRRKAKDITYPLNCWQVDRNGSRKRVTLHLRPVDRQRKGPMADSKDELMKRCQCSDFNLVADKERTFTRYNNNAEINFMVLQPEIGYED